MPRSMWDELAETDRTLADLFRAFGGPWGMRPLATTAPGQRFMPTTDIFARDGDLVIRLDLPGVDPEKDVSVTYESGELTIRGERKEEKDVKEEGYYRHESAFGAFERHIPVPSETKESDIKAEYTDGVLELVVPRAAQPSERAGARQIPIKSTKQLASRSREAEQRPVARRSEKTRGAKGKGRE